MRRSFAVRPRVLRRWLLLVGLGAALVAGFVAAGVVELVGGPLS